MEFVTAVEYWIMVAGYWAIHNILDIVALCLAIYALVQTQQQDKINAERLYVSAWAAWNQHYRDNMRSECWTDVSALRLYDPEQVAEYKSAAIVLSKYRQHKQHAEFLNLYADYINNYLTTKDNNFRSDKLEHLRIRILMLMK